MFTDEDSEDQAEVTACIHSIRSITPASMIPWWWGWQLTPSNHAPYSGAWAGRPGPSMGTAVGGNEWDTEKYMQTKGSTELGGRGARQALDLRVRWKCGSSDGAEKFGRVSFLQGRQEFSPDHAGWQHGWHKWSWRQSSGDQALHVEGSFMGTDAQLPSSREVREEGQQKTQREKEGWDPGRRGVIKTGGGQGWERTSRRIIHTSQYCDFLSV